MCFLLGERDGFGWFLCREGDEGGAMSAGLPGGDDVDCSLSVD